MNKKILNKGHRYKPIKTERLLLIKPNLKYINEYYLMLSDKHQWEFNGSEKDKFTKAQARKSIIKKIEKWKLKKGFSFFVLYNNKLVGSIGSYDERPHFKTLEIGYFVHYNFWNKGFGTEMLTGFLNWTFTNTIINRISATVAVPHIASIKVLKKNGFKREGRLRENVIYDGKTYDDYIYSLLRKDWIKRKKKK